jgi:hypothetical protein
MSETTRTRRSKDERLAALDKKIQSHRDNIESLEIKKYNILNPKSRKKSTTIKTIVEQAKEAGMTIEDIALKLGVKLEK